MLLPSIAGRSSCELPIDASCPSCVVLDAMVADIGPVRVLASACVGVMEDEGIFERAEFDSIDKDLELCGDCVDEIRDLDASNVRTKDLLASVAESAAEGDQEGIRVRNENSKDDEG
jgi:hypothetical protein